MKKIINEGKYTLIETKGNTKVIFLSGIGAFAWINALRIGEILIKAHNKFKFESVLSMGNYKLFDVKEDPKLTDLQHLELEVGDNKWQGYLLPKGLPTTEEKRHRIIPTYELVPSKNGRNNIYDEMLEKVEVMQDHTVKINR